MPNPRVHQADGDARGRSPTLSCALAFVTIVLAGTFGSCLRAQGLEFARAPYLGVSCPEPNSTVCDRVGLAVWITGNVQRVDATAFGRTIELAAVGPRFEGFFQPAGLARPPFELADKWTGDPAAMVSVTVRATVNGKQSRRNVALSLAPGWG